MLFVLVFPVAVLAWIGFGVGAAMVAVLGADAPKPPPASSIPKPDGWTLIDDTACAAKNCSTRAITLEAPAGVEATPPARRLIVFLETQGWRVDADTPARAESSDGITVDAAPPGPVATDPNAPAAPATTVAPPTTKASAAITTTTVPTTTTTVSPAVAANRATVTIGFRSAAAGRAYQREGLAMQHIKGFYRILAVLTAATIALGLLLFVLDQFVG